MSEVTELLARFAHLAAHPKEQMEHYRGLGKQVVGCFPSYTPEELVYAAGMVPMGLWGGPVEPFLAKKYLPAFACPILQSTLEMGLNGTYNGLAAVIIPTLCDTFRCITQDWLAGVPDIPMIPVSYPQNRTEAGMRFLAHEYGVVREKLETICGHAITQADIDGAITVYNTHAELMRQFAALANDHLDIITPTVRHAVMKSAWFTAKEEHSALMAELIEALKTLPPYHWTGKRVILTGIASEPDGLLSVLEDNHLAVVGDDLAQESRQYRADIPAVGDSAEARLAGKWKEQLCSLAHDASKSRVDMLVDLAKVTGADGAVACMMKFCDPEEYDFPLIAKALDAIGVPTLFLEVDQQPGSLEQVRTRLQTFAEMLG